MTNYLIRRLFQMIIVVLLSTMAIYVLLNVAPGGPLSGLRTTADRRARVSDTDIARLTAYLGLDKPLMLRYLTWLIGDDWLGADWMYVGFTQYKQPKLGRDGQPRYKRDPETGEQYLEYETSRFWVDPHHVQFNPGYELWVWGEKTGPNEFHAERIKVKPAPGEERPDDIVVWGDVYKTVGSTVTIVDKNENYHTLSVDRETVYLWPEGEGRPRPAEGNWMNISWLTGFDGLLAKYSGFNGPNEGILRLDFGFSWNLAASQPVGDLLKSRLGNTLRLMTTAAVLSLIVAIPIGIYSGVHQYSKTDYAVTTFAFFGSAMPVFWFGLMLILTFSYGFKEANLPYMPAGGVAALRTSPPGSLLNIMNVEPGSIIDKVVHLIMPAMMLSLLYMAGWSRYMRSAMLEVLRQDYVRTARAKGLLERVVIYKHALRNALIPIITIVVFTIPGIFGGATLTETIFSYPGIGRLYFDALGANDWPVVMSILFISAILVVFATLLGDILYSVVDPRIRFK